MKDILKKIVKSDLTYSLIFLSIYLSIFLSITAGIFFIAGFSLTFFLVTVKKTLKKYPFLIVLVMLIPLILGYMYLGVYEVVGFMLGSSIAGFMMGNYFTSSTTDKITEDTLIDLQEIIKITSVTQVLFSLYFFYTLIIEDIRGQNKLDTNLVYLAIAGFVVLIPLTQIVIKKLFYKRLDIVSYTNILFLAITGVIFGIFYFSFLEIGLHNVLLPAIYTVAGILLISAYVAYSKDKQFKLKRTLATLIFVGAPLLLMLYYPWTTSRYLGVMASCLTLVLFLPNLFTNEKNIQISFRITNVYVLVVNIYLILMALFSLSSKGIIARLNIANIDYLLMLMFGMFLVMFLSDIKDAVHNVLTKYNLASTYSVIMVALGTLTCYLILDLGGIEGIGSFLFGIAGYMFIKNSFELRGKINNKNLAYTYLENNLLNLLTVLTLSLILVKI
jgi:hypothetical protein